MNKVRKLISMVNNSNNIFLHMGNNIDKDPLIDIFGFVKDMKVRWNSTYIMLERLFKLKAIETGAQYRAITCAF